MIKLYRGGDDNEIQDLIKWLDARVQYWSKYACNLSNLDCQNVKLENWKNEALDYLAGNGISDFIYTRYGYAVEELTNIDILANDFSKSTFSIALQVDKGCTRPDIVVYIDKNEYAWLDITSEQSAGHILYKCNWFQHHTPVIGEICYPRLNLSNVVNDDSGSITDSTAFSRRQRLENQKERADYRYMTNCINRALARIVPGSNPFGVSVKNIADELQVSFGVYFNDNYKHPIVKSMLELYVIQDSATYRDLVRSYLRCLYKSISPNRGEAVKYIKMCYDNSKIYC